MCRVGWVRFCRVFVEGRRRWGEMEIGEKEGGIPGIHFAVFISERSCGVLELVYLGSGV